ncbi:hypothetical protein MACH09_10350 [Vibrio sp. MACH09]|nr:hypothetical protein MACH09_10350 [Vibrio sp. MACH09]
MLFVKSVFSKVSGVSLSIDIFDVNKITSIRYDIVIRNGVSIDVNKASMNVNDFENCIVEILNFVSTL